MNEKIFLYLSHIQNVIVLFQKFFHIAWELGTVN